MLPREIYTKSVTTSEVLPASQVGRPTWTTWNTTKAIKQGYDYTYIVQACISLIASSSASVPWIVRKKG